MRGATGAPQGDARAADNFNPRSSCEERPGERVHHKVPLAISIHAPHARSDGCRKRGGRYVSFQSTLLMRGATRLTTTAMQTQTFQSTLLMRGATSARVDEVRDFIISIHAPHARSDVDNPILDKPILDISIHAPHARIDNVRFYDVL